jgi:hypothetical protein
MNEIIIVPHRLSYGVESWSEANGRRVRLEGVSNTPWYKFLKWDKEEDEDWLERIPRAVLEKERAVAENAEKERIAGKGHDCDEYVCHGMYERDNGTMNDYYYCGKCDEVLQTG